MVACMVCCAPGHLVAAGGSTKSRSVPTLVPGDMARCSIALTKAIMSQTCFKTTCGFEFVCFF